MFLKAQFGSRLREVREKRGVTQTEVAQTLGVTQTMLSDMEKGRRTTTIERFQILCQYYNVSADYLLGLSEEPRELTPQSAGAHNSPQ